MGVWGSCCASPTSTALTATSRADTIRATRGRGGRRRSEVPTVSCRRSRTTTRRGAVVAVLGGAHAGVYNVVDDEPLRRRDYFAALAKELGVPPPKLVPPWVVHLTGSVGETVARSLRVSNRKLRRECAWAPRYRSVREGYRAVVAELKG